MSGSYLEYTSKLLVEKLDEFSALVVLLGEIQHQAPHRSQQLEGTSLIHVLLVKGHEYYGFYNDQPPPVALDQLTYLKEGNDLPNDAFDLTVQLLGIDLRAAHISRRTFCSQTQ